MLMVLMRGDTMTLTVKTAGQDKPYKLADTAGLLYVAPTGLKSWRKASTYRTANY